MQFDDYAPALGAAYHALKTSDHISRYRRDIVDRLERWLQDDAWLDRTAGDLALQRRVTPAQAEHEINHALRFIVEQLEGLDPLLAELDRRHTQYLRTSLRQVRYQMGSADGTFKDRLVALAQGLARLQEDGLGLLPADAPGPGKPRCVHPTGKASTPCPSPARRLTRRLSSDHCSTRGMPRRCVCVALREIGAGITPQRIQQFVGRFLNGNGRIHASELPPDFYADMPWAISALAYGHHPEVYYGVEAAHGDPVEIGPYRVQPFELVKLRPKRTQRTP